MHPPAPPPSAELPPQALYSGELGAPLCVVSCPEIRIAECMAQEQTIETLDGLVRARAGDFVVSMPGGERFPVQPDIYFGTYEVISQVGPWHVGRRLMHPRKAWPIVSSGAEFDYGADRGRASAERGGWVYQSDERDYGLINRQAAAGSHIVVGAAAQVQGTNWRRRLDAVAIVLTGLPPVLTALALGSLHLSTTAPQASLALLVAEALLLAGGAALAWVVQRQHWPLRAVVGDGLALAQRFQVVAEALGAEPSRNFPAMTLWRAAQRVDDDPRKLHLSAERLQSIKTLVDETKEAVGHEAHRYHAMEGRVSAATWFAAGVVLVCLVLVAWLHIPAIKLLAIWIPSAVGAAHAWTWRRQWMQRARASADMVRELRFVRSQLASLAPRDGIAAASQEDVRALVAALRMLCRSVAGHSQREIQMTAAEGAGVPV